MHPAFLQPAAPVTWPRVNGPQLGGVGERGGPSSRLPWPRSLAHPGLSRAGPPLYPWLAEAGVPVAAGMVTECETNKADLQKPLVAF